MLRPFLHFWREILKVYFENKKQNNITRNRVHHVPGSFFMPIFQHEPTLHTFERLLHPRKFEI